MIFQTGESRKKAVIEANPLFRNDRRRGGRSIAACFLLRRKNVSVQKKTALRRHFCREVPAPRLRSVAEELILPLPPLLPWA